MKLRIRGNSLRFRLDKKDISDLEKSKKVRDETNFPTSRFAFEILADSTISGIRAVYENSTISLRLPLVTNEKWIKSEDVGIYENIEFEPNASPLRLTIEKDFACLTVREGEDDTYAFPNPNETC